MLQTFNLTSPGAIPSGWSIFNPGSAATFGTTTTLPLISGNGLQSSGSSTGQARTWSNTALPSDAQISASIYLNSLVPGQVIGRGQNLGSSTPTYYAVSVVRGMEVQLLEVVNGKSTVLASISTQNWLSGVWVDVSLTMVGKDLYVQVFREDTAQYLNANGDWQSALTQAIHIQNGAISGGGYAGLARPAAYSGTVSFNDFESAPPPNELFQTSLVDESFGQPIPGGLPAGWQQWSPDGASMWISTSNTLTQGAALTTSSSAPGGVTTWLNSLEPADVNVSATVYLQSLAPAEIIGRGQNLGTNQATYYAATITRGVDVQLVSVVNGKRTVLATLESNQWLSQQWAEVTLSMVGNDLRVMVYRTDTGRYLDSAGNWQIDPQWAIEVHNSAITGAGMTGLGRADGVTGNVAFDSFAISQDPAPKAQPQDNESFDQTTAGGLPKGWTQSSSDKSKAFQVENQLSISSPSGFMSNGSSATWAAAWLNQQYGPDVTVKADVVLNSLVPTQLVARAQGLNGSSPSYYAVSITRGLDVQILGVQHGVTTVLSDLTSNGWTSGIWVNVSLTVQGNTLEVEVYRLDNGQYLNQDGNWQAAPAIAMSVNDSTLTKTGSIGIVRPASYSGAVYYDNFSVVQSSAPPSVSTPPVVTVPPPPPNTPPNQQPGSTTPPPTTGTGSPNPNTNLPSVITHYPYIRIAELAYNGTPLDSAALNLLRNSVDLVVSDTGLQGQINSIAPTTPQFFYANFSNIYGAELTSWLDYANAHGFNPEDAFLHTTQATQFTGASPSSIPVNWFWSVQLGSGSSWTDYTSQAHSTGNPDVPFGTVGQSLAIAYPDRFNQINVNLSTVSGAGWTGQFQYVSAVDANGNPTQWTNLPTTTDTTIGLKRSGQITFTPPANWKMASINGSAGMYYVRILTTHAGAAPVASSILGYDYVHAAGTSSGVIPVFDSAADANGDGYLSSAEYANRASGMDAQFAYQSRVFYPSYGQMRFATNVANPEFQQWAIWYTKNLLAANPKAVGVFVDNSPGKIALDPSTIAESLTNYSTSYAGLLAAINKAVAPHWLIANVAGGGTAVYPLAANGVSLLDESVLRPLAATWSQFEDVASNVQQMVGLSNGRSYVILDSLATGNQAQDPQWQIATLAYYYLVGDPKETMLMFNGGGSPNTSWSQHFSNAVNFNVGQPQGTWSVFAQGTDPANAALTYKVYGRQYQNALVLYKPLSYSQGVSGSTNADTTTTLALNGTYRTLNADGTLGAPITRITLKNGQGAILVKG